MPATIRDGIGIAEGMHIMLIGDLDRREIRIVPFADPEANLVELQITLKDIPGALAKAATILADNNIDLLTSQSRTLRRGKSAEWIVIADISKADESIDKICSEIVNKGAAEKATHKKFI
jgi:prephenate dehydratase